MEACFVFVVEMDDRLHPVQIRTICVDQERARRIAEGLAADHPGRYFAVARIAAHVHAAKVEPPPPAWTEVAPA